MEGGGTVSNLAASNNQGELSPLEIGIHALHCVALAAGGRGKKAGLSEYAERLGKAVQSISLYRQAAEVAENVKPSIQIDGLQEKAQHLAAIHALPKSTWQACVEHVVAKELSASRECPVDSIALCQLCTKRKRGRVTCQAGG
jgi:hypothetical protein